MVLQIQGLLMVLHFFIWVYFPLFFFFLTGPSAPCLLPFPTPPFPAGINPAVFRGHAVPGLRVSRSLPSSHSSHASCQRPCVPPRPITPRHAIPAPILKPPKGSQRIFLSWGLALVRSMAFNGNVDFSWTGSCKYPDPDYNEASMSAPSSNPCGFDDRLLGNSRGFLCLSL